MFGNQSLPVPRNLGTMLRVRGKSASDQPSPVQSGQDLLWCRERLLDLISWAILTQFAENHLIAMFGITGMVDRQLLVGIPGGMRSSPKNF